MFDYNLNFKIIKTKKQHKAIKVKKIIKPKINQIKTKNKTKLINKTIKPKKHKPNKKKQKINQKQ